MKASLSKEHFSCLFILGAAVFVASIFWINFHGAQWYHFDMYQDVLVAERMAEQHTFFPDNWVFGNQYYIIATPVVAAFFYALCGDGILAMSLASSLMTLLILGCFLWCCAPFFSRKSLAVGLFCLSGACILGNSASTCTTGLQLLYTMASYYACYLLGILLHLGIYFRLRTGRRVHPALWSLALLTDLALGMQSLRETLILNIPLVMLELYAILRMGRNRRSTVFVFAGACANLAGVILIRLLPVQSTVIYDAPALNLSPSALSTNFRSTLASLSSMIGLPAFLESWKWKPLGLLGFFFAAVVLGALVLILRQKAQSLGGLFLLFCVLSLAGVFATGVLVFRVRNIYFFVWFLLVCFSFMIWSETLPQGCLRNLFLTALLIGGIGSYVYQFYPDFYKYPADSRFYRETAETLYEQEGVDFILFDFLTFPALAASSEGKIHAVTFKYAFEAEDDALLKPVEYLKPIDLFENIDPAHSMIVLSDSAFGDMSSQEFIQALGPDGYYDALMSRLTLVGTAEGAYITLYFYRFEDPALIKT